jgi:two-component system, NtrC family, nitrogen regulation sensor histidine kinase NtrY
LYRLFPRNPTWLITLFSPNLIEKHSMETASPDRVLQENRKREPAHGAGRAALTAEQKEARRRKREVVLILCTFLVFLLLTAVELSLGKIHTALPFNDNVLFFAIININIILILLMIFLITRNIVKLVFERRQRVLGATLRTKLVAAFVLLSLVPTGILFYVAWSFISRSIEMWVHVQVERALDGALAVSRSYYMGRLDDALYFAKQIGRSLEREGLFQEDSREKLQDFLRLQQMTYRLDAVLLVRSGPGETVSLAASDGGTPPFLPDSDSLREVREGREITRLREAGGGEILEAMVRITEPKTESFENSVLVVQNRFAPGLVEKMAQISQSLERHQQMMLFKYPFKSVFFMALIMVTLLILFSATWFGFFLAKGMTIPIQRLADGIREVASGNLSQRIEMASEDEMGVLVDSYNRMIEDLRTTGEQVADAQLRLQKTNEELENRRRYMEILLKNVGAGVLSMDREGRIQTINRFLEQLFSVRAGDLLGREYREMFFGDTLRPIRDFIDEVNTTRLRSMERQIHVTLNQEPKTLRIRTSVLEDEEGAWMGMVMVFEDHSELIRAQRVAAWREVARRIAHEIKNPLTPIQLSAQRLQKRYGGRLGEDGKVFEDCTGTIIRQVEEMKNLVNEFSQFARMPAAKPELSNLNQIVDQVLSFYRQAHRSISFVFEPAPTLPELMLDPDQMRRVLNNLLDNAVDASGNTGRISIVTRFEPFLRIAVLEIADEGSGIPREMRDRIFDPYASSKKGGTGLGLVIVKTIVSDHNGYIRVRENVPRGTRFFLEFPVPVA